MPFNFAGLLLFGLCWGASVPLLKVAVSAGHHPLGMLIWQLVVAVVALGLLVLVKREPVPLNRKIIVYYAVIAFLGTLIPNTFGLLAIKQLPAGIMAITNALVPITSLCIALTLRLEPFSRRRFLGVILGVGSLMMIALPESSLPEPGKVVWLFVALVAPLCYAMEGNYVAALAPRAISPIVTLFAASVLGLLLLLPVVVIGGWSVSPLVVWDSSRWSMLFAALAHVIAYTGYLWLLGRAGAVFTSQIAYIVTMAGVLGAVLFLQERYGITVWFAVVMILVAISLVRPLTSKV